MKNKENLYICEPVRTVNGETITKRYLKLKKVGEGTYSKCYLVKNEESDSTYVAKTIPKDKLAILLKERLFYQIRIHQQLSHPNVVHLDHWFEDEEYQYIFLEYCSEGNLEMLMKKRELTEKEIKNILKQIIQALIYIHSKNMLHRDLKLCNFYIDHHNTIKLGDFGFACQLSHPGELKRESCGTPNFIAPQAVSGFGYSFSSDVWSVGVIMYRLRYGVCPFEGPTVRETLQKIKLCQYTFPKLPKASSDFKDLIGRIFVLNYDDRLNLHQILNHPFLSQTGKKPKKSFSLMKFIFRGEDDDKPVLKSNKAESKVSPRQSRLSQPKRMNSCEASKQIKEIFKNKSKGDIRNSVEMRTEGNISVVRNGRMDTFGQADMDHSHMFGPSVESKIGNSIANPDKQGNRASRLNNFIGSIKDQLKSHPQKTLETFEQAGLSKFSLHATKGLSQNLTLLLSKHYLPYQIQIQKDIAIAHLRPNLKLVIYNSTGYFLTQSALLNVQGSVIPNCPKTLRYVVDHLVKIVSCQEEIPFSDMRLFLPQEWILTREGIILFYSSALACKLYNQNNFYVTKLSTDGKEDARLSVMYEGQFYKMGEGVVVSRIYQGWVANSLKSRPQR